MVLALCARMRKRAARGRDGWCLVHARTRRARESGALPCVLIKDPKRRLSGGAKTRKTRSRQGFARSSGIGNRIPECTHPSYSWRGCAIRERFPGESAPKISTTARRDASPYRTWGGTKTRAANSGIRVSRYQKRQLGGKRGTFVTWSISGGVAASAVP